MILDLLTWKFNVDIKATKTAIYADVDCVCPECRNLYFAIKYKNILPYELIRFLSKASIPINKFEHQSGVYINNQIYYNLEYSFIGSIIKGKDSKQTDLKARRGNDSYMLNYETIDKDFQIAASSANTSSHLYKHLPEATIIKLYCNFKMDWMLKEDYQQL